VISSPFKFLGFLIESFTKLVRMSLGFKITFMYSMIFLGITFMYHGILFILSSNLDVSYYVNFEDGIAISLFAFSAFGLFIIIFFGSKVSKNVLKPIKTMTKDIKSISGDDFSKRLNISQAKDELKDLSTAFNNLLEKLQEMYDKQNIFVSDASHELRTPIAVIQGYANLLNRWGKGDEEVLDESIFAIQSESENMKDLVEKLLFLARADKNKLKLEKEFFNITTLVNEIYRETEMITNKHQIISKIDFEGNIFGDSASIKQALRVFIDNSIKYTEEGGSITISLYKFENDVIIKIEDTGVGIPKEDIPYIFDRFYRSDKSRTKETGGNGLGLSIAKWILDQHHCNVKVSSKLNVGTAVEIIFKYI